MDKLSRKFRVKVRKAMKGIWAFGISFIHNQCHETYIEIKFLKLRIEIGYLCRDLSFEEVFL